MKKAIALLLTAALSVTVLAGCGGDDGGSSAAPSGGGNSQESTPAGNAGNGSENGQGGAEDPCRL